MLSDKRLTQERWAASARRNRRTAKEFGDFLAHIRPWCWVATFTFRDQGSDEMELPRKPVATAGVYTRLHQDPRIANWEPSSRASRPHSVGQQRAISQIQKYLRELGKAAKKPIAWILAEDFGSIGGRFHAHLLIAGVNHLSTRIWWLKAFSRFGRSKIEHFDVSRGGAHYIAKIALAGNGNLHFGGELSDRKVEHVASSSVGRIVVAKSAEVPSALFHLTLGRRRKR